MRFEALQGRQNQPKERLGFEAVMQDIERRFKDIPIEINGQQHLDSIMEHTNLGGSVMFSLNHTSMLDPLVASQAVNANLLDNPKSVHQLVALSSKFYPHIYDSLLEDPKQLLNVSMIKGLVRHAVQAMRLESKFIHAYGKLHGIRFLEMVQSHRMGTGRFLRHNAHIDKESFDHVAEAVIHSPTWFGISIEGTRSKKKLGKAQAGFARIFRKDVVKEKMLITPIALAGVKRNLFDTTTPIVVNVGKPVSYYELIDDAKEFDLELQDILMMRTAIMMPVEDRGYYNDNRFTGYMKHLEDLKNSEG